MTDRADVDTAWPGGRSTQPRGLDCHARTVNLPRASTLRPHTALLAVAAAALLAGCGGSGSSTPAGTSPPAATQTTFSLHDPAYAAAVAKRKRAHDAERAKTTVTAATIPATTSTITTPRTKTEAPRPHVDQRPIPFPEQRVQEMADYSARHYGEATAALTDPKVIVEHFTETPDLQSTINTFAPDTPDPELHELPNVCAHFVVDKDGTITQLVPLAIRCRHTVGLNWTAIGIEQVGSSDAEILGRPAQLDAVVRLTAWLQCKYGIATKDVIGHNESLTSPYHREGVASLRTQTHDDWQKADMDRVRALLRRQPCG